MTPQNLIAELGQKMNLPNLSLDAQGLAKLVFDASLEVNIEYDTSTNQLHLYTLLGQVPTAGKAEVFEKLLAGNLFGAATHGAVLAIDPLTGDIVITTTLQPDKTDMVDFEQALEHHVMAAEQWGSQVKPEGMPPESTPSVGTIDERFTASFMRA